MAIKKKQDKPAVIGFPSTFVRLVTKAATYQVKSKAYEDKFKSAKADVEAYLEDENCPVEVAVGEKGPKIPDVASLSFSQRTSMDKAKALEEIVAALKAGTMQPDDLSEVISTLSVEGFRKVFPNSEAIGISDKVTITVRAAATFKEDIQNQVEATESQFTVGD